MASTIVADLRETGRLADLWTWRTEMVGVLGAIAALIFARKWAFKSLCAEILTVGAVSWFQIQECGRMADLSRKLKKKKWLPSEDLVAATADYLKVLELEKKSRLWQHGYTAALVGGMGLLLTRYVTVGLGLTFASMSLLAPIACQQRKWRQEKKMFSIVINAKADQAYRKKHNDLVTEVKAGFVLSKHLSKNLKKLECVAFKASGSFADFTKLKEIKATLMEDVGFEVIRTAPILHRLSITRLLGDQTVLLRPPERVRSYTVPNLPVPKDNPFELLHKLKYLTILQPEEGCLEALIRSKKELERVELKAPFNLTQFLTGDHLPKRVVIDGFMGDYVKIEKNYDFYINKKKITEGNLPFGERVTLLRKGYGLKLDKANR